MLSAQEARKRSEKSRKAYLKHEWKKLKKKRKKTIKQGKFCFRVKELSYEARKRLKDDGGYNITRDGDYEVVSWEKSLS